MSAKSKDESAASVEAEEDQQDQTPNNEPNVENSQKSSKLKESRARKSTESMRQSQKSALSSAKVSQGSIKATQAKSKPDKEVSAPKQKTVKEKADLNSVTDTRKVAKNEEKNEINLKEDEEPSAEAIAELMNQVNTTPSKLDPNSPKKSSNPNSSNTKKQDSHRSVEGQKQITDYVEDIRSRMVYEEAKKRAKMAQMANTPNQGPGSKEIKKGGQSQGPLLIKDVSEAESTIEFVLLTLQSCLDLSPGQIQGLLVNSNRKFATLCQNGMKNGNYLPLENWFELVGSKSNFKLMIQLFVKAIDNGAFSEVSLVLSCFSCAFVSQHVRIIKAALELITRVAEEFYELETTTKDYHKQMASWFVKIQTEKQRRKQQQNVYVPAKYRSATPDVVEIKCVMRQTTDLLEQHPQLTSEVSTVLYAMFKGSSMTLTQLPPKLMAIYDDDIFMAYDTLDSVLQFLNKINRSSTRKLFEDSDVVTRALYEACENNHDYALKLKCSNFLLNVWYTYPTLVSQQGKGKNGEQKLGIGNLPLKDSFHAMLRQGVQERDKLFRVNIFAVGFSLLNRLSEKENREAPGVLKTLVAGLIEQYRNHHRVIDHVTVEVALKNLLIFLREQETIPKQFILDPILSTLISQIKSGHTDRVLRTSFEVEFIQTVCSEFVALLPEKTTLLLIEILGLINEHRPVLARLYQIPSLIGKIVALHKDSDSAIIEFVEQEMTPNSLQMLLQLKKDEQLGHLKNPLLGSPIQKKHKSPKIGSKGHKLLQKKAREAEADRKLQRNNIVSLLGKIYAALDGTSHQDVLIDAVQDCAARYRHVYNSRSSGLNHLLLNWGRLYSDRGDSVEGLRDKKEENGSAIVPVSEGAIVEKRNENTVALFEENESVDELQKKLESISIQNKSEKKSLNWQSVKEPKNRIALRAVEEYQKIKEKRLEMKNKASQDEIQKKLRQDKLNESAKKEVIKRNQLLERDQMRRKEKMRAILAGERSSMADSNSNFFSTPALSTNAESLSVENNQSSANSGQIVLYQGNLRPKRVSKELQVMEKLDDVNDYENVDSLKYAAQKFAPLWRYLFDKYTSQQGFGRLNLKYSSSTDQLSEQTIKVLEIIKMYRDHLLDHSMISKHQMQMLAKEINTSLICRYDVESVNYKGFVQFLAHTAIFVHKQGKIHAPSQTGGLALEDMTYFDMITNMVEYFKRAAKSKGQSTILYEHFDSLPKDARTARQLTLLNQQIQENPDMPLPQGFVKTTEKIFKRQFVIPFSQKKDMSDAQIVSAEILDEIMHEALGVRLLHKRIVQREKTVVRIALSSSRNSSLVDQDRGRSVQKSDLNTPLSTGGKFQSNPARAMSLGRQIPQKSKNTISQNNKQLDKFKQAAETYGLDSENQNSGEMSLDQSKSLLPEQAKMLEIYKTENVIRGMKERMDRDGASSVLTANRGIMRNIFEVRSMSHVMNRQSKTPLLDSQQKLKKVPIKLGRFESNTRLEKGQLGNQYAQIMRENERLLVSAPLSSDLKVTTYDLLNSGVQHRDFDLIRETACVLEDILQVASGHLASYPYGKGQEKFSTYRSKNSLSVISRKTTIDKKFEIFYKGPPKRPLGKHQIKKLEIKKQEEEMKSKEAQERDLKDLKRIQQTIVNKQKILGTLDKDKTDQSAEKLEISIKDIKLDKNDTVIDKKAIQRLRAKQLQISQQERELRKKKKIDEKLAKEKLDKQMAIQRGQEAKKRIQGYKMELQQYQNDVKAALNEDELGDYNQRRKNRAMRSRDHSEEVTRWKVNKNKQDHEKMKLEVYTRKERQEVLAFYLRPDVTSIVRTHEDTLGQFFEGVSGAQNIVDREIAHMTIAAYSYQFARAASLVPAVLIERDLEMIFDTIINERIDQEMNAYDDYGAENQDDSKDGSLSFEDFKKSLVRIASLVTASVRQIESHGNPPGDQHNFDSDNTFNNPWDSHDSAKPTIKRKVVLKKIPPPEITSAIRQGVQPLKLYDVSKLKVDTFKRVVEYICENLEKNEIRPIPSDYEPYISQSRNLEEDLVPILDKESFSSRRVSHPVSLQRSVQPIQEMSQELRGSNDEVGPLVGRPTHTEQVSERQPNEVSEIDKGDLLEQYEAKDPAREDQKSQSQIVGERTDRTGASQNSPENATPGQHNQAASQRSQRDRTFDSKNNNSQGQPTPRIGREESDGHFSEYKNVLQSPGIDRTSAKMIPEETQ